MNKQLISEINRIQTMMGVLNESPGPAPLITLTDDLIKGLKNLVKPKGMVGKIKSLSQPIDTILADDIETLSKGAAGTTTITNDQLKNIVKRLIKNKKIEEYLVPKMVQSNIDLQNYIKNYKSSIRDLKSRGGKLQDALDDIDVYINMRNPTTNRPYLQTELPEMKNYIRNEFRDFAEKEFESQVAKELAKTAGQKFKQGWKMGKDSKSGAILTAKSASNEIKNLFRKKMDKLKLPPDEKSVVNKFMITGIADTDMLVRAGKSLGFAGFSGNLLRQLYQKIRFLFWAELFLDVIGGTLVDLLTPGEEIPDELMSEGSKLLHRALRSPQLPSFGLVSPLIWGVGLISHMLLRGGGGSINKAGKAFIEYLRNSDESVNWWKGYDIGRNTIDKWYLASKGLRETIDGEIVRTKAGNASQSEIEKAAGVNRNNNKSNTEKHNFTKW